MPVDPRGAEDSDFHFGSDWIVGFPDTWASVPQSLEILSEKLISPTGREINGQRL